MKIASGVWRTFLIAALVAAITSTAQLSHGQQLDGKWETNPITQTSVDGYEVPPRTFKARIEFNKYGKFDYCVTQSAGIHWTLKVAGHYSVRPSGVTSAYDYPFLLTLSPVGSEVNIGGDPLPSSELTRLYHEGFPGPEERTYKLRREGDSWEIKGDSDLLLKPAKYDSLNAPLRCAP